MRAHLLERTGPSSPAGCWPWLGHIDGRGYARLGARQAYRVAYELEHGPIPLGMTVDHLCYQPACVNPEHLRLLTREDNARLQRSASKTHCVNGHPYDDANTYRRSNGRQRDCRACGRDRVRRYLQRRTAAA